MADNRVENFKYLRKITAGDYFHVNSGTLLISGIYVPVDKAILYRYNDDAMKGLFDLGAVIYAESTDDIVYTDYTDKYEGWGRLFRHAGGIPFLSPNNSNRQNGFESIWVQSAIEEARNSAEGKARFSITLSHNGTVSNGDFFGYSSLIPGDDTPIIVGKDSIFEEFTFSNKNNSADFTLYFFKNNSLFLTVVRSNTLYFVYTNINEEFSGGDEIYIRYGDNGGNASDVGMVLYFKPL